MNPYRRPFPKDWWTRRFGWAFFMVREATALAVAFYTILFTVLLWKAGQGEIAYRDYLAGLQSPWMILVHVFAIALLVLHSVTWFILTPKAIVVRFGEDKVPDQKVIGGNIALWLVLTIGIIVSFTCLLPAWCGGGS